MAQTYGGRQNILQGIQAIKETSQQHELMICYEIVPKTHRQKQIDEEEKSYPSVQAWCDDVIEHNLVATLDTTHIATWDENPATYVPLLGKRLKHVHVSDYSSEDGQHLFIGEGKINWAEFFSALKQHQSEDMYIVFEPGSRFDLLDVDKPRLQQSYNLLSQYLA
jgi:sugar phosphate isomerase/epimerase